MRLGFTGGVLAVILVVLVIIGYSSVFTVYQTRQALVVRLGNPVRVVTEPGLPPVPDEGEAQRRARMLGSILVLGGAYLLVLQTRLFEALLHQPWFGALLIVGGLIVLALRPRRRP